MRLVIHLCNPEERALEGKTCASRHEINEFLYSSIINVKIQKSSPDLVLEGKGKVNLTNANNMYYTYTQDFLYDVPASNLTVVGYEFNIMQS